MMKAFLRRGWSSFGRRWLRLGRHHLTILVFMLSVCGMLWIFLWLAGEVMEGDTGAFDRMLLLAMRTPGNHADPVGPAWLEFAASDITSLGGYPVLVLVTLAVARVKLHRGQVGFADELAQMLATGQSCR